MSTANHRDPLTLRYARTVRDTLRDPYAYSEGAQEPEYVLVASEHVHGRWLNRIECWIMGHKWSLKYITRKVHYVCTHCGKDIAQ
jgi:hypothetical protein